MNKIVLLLIISAALLFPACSSFLDKEPDSRTNITGLEDIQELLVNAYPQATYHLVCEVMSDNVTDLGVGHNSKTAITEEEMYNWQEGSDIITDSPHAVWTGLYGGIAVANHALEELEKVPETELSKALKGEALLCRAFGHFLLVNLFAEHYDPATAATAWGVPYVTEPEKNAVKTYTRNTMQETYDFIEQDMIRGLALLDEKIYKQPKYHFSHRSAHAFACRFYTYKGTDWHKVIYHADQVVTGDFREHLRQVSDFTNTVGQYREYMRQYTLPSQPAILLSVNVESYWNDMYAQCPPNSSRYTMTTLLSREIIPIISRLCFSSSRWNYHTMSTSGTAASSAIKSYGYFKAEDATSRSGMTYLNVPMLTIEDVVLNRMEAYVMLGMYPYMLRDLAYYSRVKAVGFKENSTYSLEELTKFYTQAAGRSRQDVMPHYHADLDDDKMVLLKTLVDLRRMEFLQEGMRWFDIKRFHLQVEHLDFGQTSPRVLGRHDLRRALQIPQEAQAVGVVKNERPEGE